MWPGVFSALGSKALKHSRRTRSCRSRFLPKYLKINDREVLEKSHEIYRPVYKRILYGDRRAVRFALDQMGKEVPDAAKLDADKFIDNSILAELEKSGLQQKSGAFPQTRRPEGEIRFKLLAKCKHGQFQLADPDGVPIDIAAPGNAR